MSTLGLVRATARLTAKEASGAICRVRTALRAWRRNYAARCGLWRCAQFDPRFASDIGLTQGDIAMAARMPFWVPDSDRSGERS